MQHTEKPHNEKNRIFCSEIGQKVPIDRTIFHFSNMVVNGIASKIVFENGFWRYLYLE